jgi:hypothetical protein
MDAEQRRKRRAVEITTVLVVKRGPELFVLVKRGRSGDRVVPPTHDKPRVGFVVAAGGLELNIHRGRFEVYTASYLLAFAA